MEREKVIRILKYYNDIDGHITFACSVLAEYEDRYYGLHSRNSFESNLMNTNKISNPTETAAMNIPDYISREINETQSLIEQLTMLKTAIAAEIHKLPLVEKNILIYFYFKGFQWIQISNRVNYSKTQCKRIRCKALEKLNNFFEQNELIRNFHYPN